MTLFLFLPKLLLILHLVLCLHTCHRPHYERISLLILVASWQHGKIYSRCPCTIRPYVKAYRILVYLPFSCLHFLGKRFSAQASSHPSPPLLVLQMFNYVGCYRRLSKYTVAEGAHLENQCPTWGRICTQLAMALHLLQKRKKGRLKLVLKTKAESF